MGQKVNPISFRIGINQPWQSRWYADNKEFKKLLIEDINLRRVLERRFSMAGVESIEIERLPKSVKTRLRVSRPGVVIGRGGAGIEEARRYILESLGFKNGDKKAPKIEVSVEEIKEPEVSAKLVAQRIASDLERRLPQRRVVNKSMERVMAAGAKGIKVALSGRIGGAEIARHEKYQKGSMPTQSLRATIDYAHVPALLKRGYVGVKVWVHRKKENATA
ncbi:MAG: 30S ribosomal protein S3 [Candidatus Blackburnbacteria bacterium RIFCSPHIGHO2_02_FULL_39_13]|uniref:Small ribosomal subunit protein uS3 n=1 Tax=Candidatus Blackburnbacteria bacterium RIFCSPLOWO2_01_FULL_40_20 TaxID=1797519 RepID=A0A1G1VD56_9BACT|nr:MAG: 30S ribosomal protein S3 [Microgenomates group bacterium GW2011_GWA2_39_19]OGY07001.1 MAG: 30S ribosomal protein S3 [Candidatus Blackburnbacteria bacterium RIFCSPHIGHO2_01_FULL_40_17]OGY08514.1 MAG: 30S ribosomal protein S3 [Candidatus Blackburnbacteria bacterium RIFCSPHIGHO2_02_FULL_39_13]OGY13281.1 MAG: 30S ribosomal protein S3 [Candidatus Blackburnbacteria bacterium RIFCSPLOWO2_01_FULL_40_20]OGY15604.1 MAG: 30S ribosomal protein S3 [Candidatus Blackburnbacteria bacterium RIFCSPLOWO2_